MTLFLFFVLDLKNAAYIWEHSYTFEKDLKTKVWSRWGSNPRSQRYNIKLCALPAMLLDPFVLKGHTWEGSITLMTTDFIVLWVQFPVNRFLYNSVQFFFTTFRHERRPKLYR